MSIDRTPTAPTATDDDLPITLPGADGDLRW